VPSAEPLETTGSPLAPRAGPPLVEEATLRTGPPLVEEVALRAGPVAGWGGAPAPAHRWSRRRLCAPAPSLVEEARQRRLETRW